MVDCRTGDLAQKGESLLNKINSVDSNVGGRIRALEDRIAELESPVDTPVDTPRVTPRQQEPPEDTPPPKPVTHTASRTPTMGEGPTTIDDISPDDHMDATARSRVAYERARTLNTPTRPSERVHPEVSPLPRPPTQARGSTT